MSEVTTIASSTAALKVPYTCRCAFCGATIHGEDKIEAVGYAFANGYASETSMNVSSNLRAASNLPFELDYAEQRLAHYRGIVADGKLMAYLKTGRVRKEDFFRVEAGSALEDYLKSGDKTVGQAERDEARLTDWPYRWKKFDKKSAVRCPECNKLQPWCLNPSNKDKGAVPALVAFLGVLFALTKRDPHPSLKTILLFIALSIVAGAVACLIWRWLRLLNIARKPWKAEDLPVYDAQFLARKRAQLSETQDQRKKGHMAVNLDGLIP